MDESRLWRVSSVLYVPTSVPTAPGGGPPTHLTFESRMPEQAMQFAAITIAIRKGRYDAHSGDPQIEAVELVADVPADADAWSAIRRLGPTVEAVVDRMSFEMATRLVIGPTTAVDVTPPVAVGERRALSSFSDSPFDNNARTVEMQAVSGSLLGTLPTTLDIESSEIAAVLRWFVKSLNTNLLHDQFIFLWIALETLCDLSPIKVEQPYTCRHGHAIETCPTCDAPTTQLVRGATMRAFLEHFEVSVEQGKELWAVRQMMHGAIPFDSDKLRNLGAHVQQLRAVVAADLKNHLGKQASDPPIVVAQGLTIHPAVAAEGTRPISEHDISPLMP